MSALEKVKGSQRFLWLQAWLLILSSNDTPRRGLSRGQITKTLPLFFRPLWREKVLSLAGFSLPDIEGKPYANLDNAENAHINKSARWWRILVMKTTERVRRLDLYASSCCLDEAVFDLNDQFARCPKCDGLCSWDLVEIVYSWQDLELMEPLAA